MKRINKRQNKVKINVFSSLVLSHANWEFVINQKGKYVIFSGTKRVYI